MIYLCQKLEKPVDNEWPLNLLWAVDQCLKNDRIAITNFGSWDHERGVLHAISMLPRTIGEITILHYRYGMNVSAIAALRNVRTDQVEASIRFAIRQLSRPQYRDYVLYGLNYTNRISDVRKREKDLKIKERLLREKEQKLGDEGMVSGYTEVGQKTMSAASFPSDIRYLGISARAIHAVVRYLSWDYGMPLTDCYSTDNLIGIVRNGELMKLRNVGNITAKEILLKVRELTGEDYSFLYKINLGL